MRLRPTLLLALGLAAGCALKGDVRKVELQVEALRAERARAEAERAAQVDSLRALLVAVQQALAAQQAYLVQMRGDVRTDLVAVQQQLVQVQELTGQSQQRLSELRARIEERAQQPVPPVDTTGRPAGGGPPGGPSGNPGGPGPDQMYDLSLQQFRRGSLGTARLGFREFLRLYSTHERAPDALFYLGELRWRILWSLLAIVLATVAGWFLVERADIIGLLIRPIKPLLPDGKLKFTHPTEPFFITLKFAFVLGLVLSSPVVIYQAWAFLAPALYPREKRLIVPALSAGVVLFLGGATIAYLWVLPRALRVLFAFQQNVFDPIITAEGYFGF